MLENIENPEIQVLTQKIYEMVKNTIKNLSAYGHAPGSGDNLPGASVCLPGTSVSQPGMSEYLSGTSVCVPEPSLKTLILTSAHGDGCHPALERLGGICAQLCGDDVDLDSVGCVVIYDLTLENMSKLASGCIDNRFTKTAALALLKGIPVLAVREGVELLKYEQCSSPYFNVLNEGLAKLSKNGVRVVGESGIDEAVRGIGESRYEYSSAGAGVSCRSGAPGAAGSSGSSGAAGAAGSAVYDNSAYPGGKSAVLSKKILTESDVRSIRASGAGELLIGPKAIVTSLAAEYAVKNNIVIVRKT
jgi:ethanolamine utilization protein